MTAEVEIRMRRIRVKVIRPAAMGVAKDAVRRLVTNTTRKIYNQASVNCPVDTGNLRGQHYMRTSETATRVRGQVGNTAKYAAAVHNGTVAHTIRARRRKALRFSGADGVIHARSVRHPGSPARPWLARAAQQVALQEGHRWTAEQA
jgi:hypothetical protein